MIAYEMESLGRIALNFISPNSKKPLPKTLHDALNNIFTSESRNKDLVSYRDEVMYKPLKNKDLPFTHPVAKGKRNAIYNALCLFFLVGTKDTKTLFNNYRAFKRGLKKADFSLLFNQGKEQCLEYFCFGINQQLLNKIELCLISDDFDLFTQKLPSPFSECPSSSTPCTDLLPMLRFYNRDIPWDSFVEQYQRAENYYFKKDFEKALNTLTEIENQGMDQLPVVSALRNKINNENKDAKDAWDYFQEILN